MDTFNIKALGRKRQTELRKFWKESKKRCRVEEKALLAILNTTPPSPDSVLEEPVEPPAGPVAQPPPELPVLSPTTPPISPTQATVAKLNEHTKQIKGKLTSLERENKLLKIKFRMEQKKNSRMRKKN